MSRTLNWVVEVYGFEQPGWWTQVLFCKTLKDAEQFESENKNMFCRIYIAPLSRN